jgi:hypothetical protein
MAVGDRPNLLCHVIKRIFICWIINEQSGEESECLWMLPSVGGVRGSSAFGVCFFLNILLIQCEENAVFAPCAAASAAPQGGSLSHSTTLPHCCTRMPDPFSSPRLMWAAHHIYRHKVRGGGVWVSEPPHHADKLIVCPTPPRSCPWHRWMTCATHTSPSRGQTTCSSPHWKIQ